MSIYKKLLEIQAIRPRVARLGTASGRGGRPYKYATLDDVIDVLLPLLTQNGVVMYQAAKSGPEGHDTLETVLTCTETKEQITSSINLRMAGVDSWHDAGAALTYARRYALIALFNIAGEEDDDAARTMDNGPNHAARPRDDGPRDYDRRDDRGHSPTGGGVPACPDCRRPGMKSKYPSKDGLEFYCRDCKQSY